MDDSSGAAELVVFPSADGAFRAHVEWAIEQLAFTNAADLEAYLFDAYPDARVRERIALAQVGGHRAWYVYRDGSARASAGKDWWTKPGLPEFIIDREGTYVAASAAAAALVGRSVAHIIGMRIGSLTRHEAVDDPGFRAFDVLAATGSLESTAVVLRPDGKEIRVRYRLTGTPADGYRMVMARR